MNILPRLSRIAAGAAALLAAAFFLESAMSAPPPSASNLALVRGVAYSPGEDDVVVAFCPDTTDCRLYRGRRAARQRLDPLPLDRAYNYAWPSYAPDGRTLVVVRWSRDMDTRSPGSIRQSVVRIDEKGGDEVIFEAAGFLTSPIAIDEQLVVAFQSDRLGVDPGCIGDCPHHAETWKLVRAVGGKVDVAPGPVDFAGGIFAWDQGRFLAAAARRDGPASAFAPVFLIGGRAGPIETAATPAALRGQAQRLSGEAGYPGAAYLALLQRTPQASALSGVALPGLRSVRANTAITASGAAVVVDPSGITAGTVLVRRYQWTDRADKAWSAVGPALSLSAPPIGQ